MSTTTTTTHHVLPKSAKRPAAADGQIAGNPSKRQRGRPRVLEPDETTAADRRRTQIRLAQRAYRQRKETTIASCKHQVTDLQTVIRDMKNTFANFNLAALRSRLAEVNPGLAKELEMTAQSMDLLAQKAEYATSDAMKDDDKSNFGDAADRSSSEVDTTATSTLDWNDAQFKSTPTTQSPPDSGVPSMWGYSVIYEPESSSSVSPPTLRQNEESDSEATTAFIKNAEESRMDQDYLQRNFSDLLHTPNDLNAQNFMTLSLPSPTTYSFHETSFARRLHRACLEDAFYLLTNPGATPDAIWKKFKFALPFSRFEDIRNRLKIRLSRTTDEPLESSYYEADDRQIPWGAINMQSSQTAKPFRTIGPQRYEAATQAPINWNEKWFRPEDVQSFVESKGFFFSGSVSFAEGEIITVVPAAYSDDIRPDVTFLQSPPKTPDLFVEDAGCVQRYNNKSLTGAPDGFPNHLDHMTSNACPQNEQIMHNSSHFGAQTDIQSLGLYGRPTLMRKRVLLDVMKFITELVGASVCRGRSPGIRQEDLERAFNASAIAV